MKTLRFHAFGGSGVLKMEDLPRPELGEEELLVKVMAASVNPVDYKIREGKYPPVKADKLPYVPGRDIAGIVEACGGLVDDWKKGDAIFAMLGIERGGYAEYAIVKDSEAAPKPRALDFVAAASVPLAGLTAWQGLFRYGELKAGQRVLIRGGSGGVNHSPSSSPKSAALMSSLPCPRSTWTSCAASAPMRWSTTRRNASKTSSRTSISSTT